MKRDLFARPFAHPSLGIILLVALLALAGCGRGSSTPEAEIPPTSTLIPTVLAPTATPVPVEPTATSEPVASETPAQVEATEGVTATGEMTATQEVTETQEVTQTEAITTTEAMTATEEMTATAEVTATEDVTETEEATATHEMTEGHVMTETVSEVVTATEEISPSAEITSSTEMTAVETANDARLFFLQPTTNAIVPITFTVVMSYTGVTLAPAADAVEGAGHMHILIDSDFIEAGQPIPNDELHRHFGDGSTTAELSLAAGSHILRLQFADNNHIALEGDNYRHEIVVNVVDGAPEQAVRIVSPTSGATVPPTFNVVMAATGFNVEPAGLIHDEAGHFHLLIDEPFVAAGELIPADDTHIHFGKAQITTTLSLEPGSYLLRLQLADGTHRALSGDQSRAEVEIIVAEDAPAEQVMFVKPADGATVTSSFLVGWAASGLIIEAAGNLIRPEAGHLHLLVNQEFVPAGEVIKMDETHLHFGKGQTDTEVSLEPGEYTLRLQMANGAHIAQDGPQYQDEITITVK